MTILITIVYVTNWLVRINKTIIHVEFIPKITIGIFFLFDIMACCCRWMEKIPYCPVWPIHVLQLEGESSLSVEQNDHVETIIIKSIKVFWPIIIHLILAELKIMQRSNVCYFKNITTYSSRKAQGTSGHVREQLRVLCWTTELGRCSLPDLCSQPDAPRSSMAIEGQTWL